MRMRKSVNTQVECLISNMNIRPFDFYNNWWNGKGVLELLQQTSRVDCYQEKERTTPKQSHGYEQEPPLHFDSEIRINLSQRN